MNKPVLTILFILLATGSTARATSHEHGDHHGAAAQQLAATHTATGVLKAVNAKAGKVQIAHDPIPALEWPSMTMWFVLKSELPQGLKAGDSVRFELRENAKKQWEIVRIERR
jgi:Cu/Ag efflux protein CusF